ncbi:SRPBCC family protein [Dactylosporangium sp. CA-139114]|uniref:SRPBCC family protein n=1 Tax=Dactylosporangium sp. CA-139114 TaxID=3239931 RepID=UPI003D95B69D
MTEPEFVETGPRPAVQVMRVYDHPIERVWRAVTTPEHLEHWFPTAAHFDLRPGGRIRFGDLGDGGSEGEVLAVEPPHRLDFLWGGQRFEFRLVPEGSGTRFTLVHHFDDRAGAASFASGWETCLRALSAVLSDEPPPPPGRAVARHEELVRRFGLDRPRVTRDAAGWLVRFERQLTCPAERAWSLFFDGDAPGVGEPFQRFGTVTEADAATAFACPGVRLTLGPGTGHGARLVLEAGGTGEPELAAAVEQWGGAVARVAREAAASDA